MYQKIECARQFSWQLKSQSIPYMSTAFEVHHIIVFFYIHIFCFSYLYNSTRESTITMLACCLIFNFDCSSSWSFQDFCFRRYLGPSAFIIKQSCRNPTSPFIIKKSCTLNFKDLIRLILREISNSFWYSTYVYIYKMINNQ